MEDKIEHGKIIFSAFVVAVIFSVLFVGIDMVLHRIFEQATYSTKEILSMYIFDAMILGIWFSAKEIYWQKKEVYWQKRQNVIK